MEKELLHRFFDGRASVEEEKQVLDWIDRDPANRRELLAERRLFDSMLMLADPGRTTRKPKVLTLPRWTREVLKYAAVILVIAGAGGIYVSRMYDKFLLTGNTITVPAGQHIDVQLPDGTKVCMNALSELHYPTFFVGRERKVRLKGEAFFDVSHDRKHPFVVETYACDVEVLGTKFNVKARSEDGEFVASLVEGKVRVTDRFNTNNHVELRPREQVTHLNGRLILGRIPEHEGFLWREGLIAFRDASFGDLLDEFEKYYGVKIEVDGILGPRTRASLACDTDALIRAVIQARRAFYEGLARDKPSQAVFLEGWLNRADALEKFLLAQRRA